MAKTLKQVVQELPTQRRKRIERRGVDLIQQQLNLRQLRRNLNLTQDRMAEFPEVKQGRMSKIENRSDILVSTLRDYIEALGGELDLVARLPGRKPVKLVGILDTTAEK